MGRKSDEQKNLEVAGLIADFVPERPEPLRDMTREQREVWKTVVNRMPEDWFPAESHELLAQYCRHVCEARRISGILRAHTVDPAVTEAWLKCYGELLKFQEREGRAMSSLATRLRITQQSTIDKRREKAMEPDAPWEE